MAPKNKVGPQIPDETEELKKRLEETEETLHAIRQYLVDAFVVNRADGTQVVTLKEADFPYRRMVEAMNEGAVTLIPDGTILYTNPHFCKMVRMGCEQAVGIRFQDLVVPDEREAFEAMLVEIGSVGNRGEFCLQSAMGGCIPVQLSVYELEMDGARGISIIITDLSERRQMEDALRKSETLFRFIATNSPDVIFSQDLDLKYTWVVNPDWPFTAEQVIGKTDWDLLPQKEAQNLSELKMRVLETGESMRRELYLSQGEIPQWYDAVYQPMFDGKGKVNGIIGYTRNITESVLAKEKIRSLASALTKAEQVERHRISQILHDDLQQRLFAIKAQLSIMTFGSDSQVSSKTQLALQQIQNELSDAIGITRNLSIDISPAVLHGEGLADAIIWLTSQMKEQFGLHVELELSMNGIILEDHMRVLLFRAVRELLFNIVKHAHTQKAAVTLEQSNGQVYVTVNDMGTGFDARAVMLDPNAAHGLLIIQDRLSLMGGSMTINSEPGKGTQVKIEVPLELNFV